MIETLFAFVLDDDDGREKLAVILAGRITLPLVGTANATVKLWPLARAVAESLGAQVRLVEYRRDHIIEAYTPLAVGHADCDLGT